MTRRGLAALLITVWLVALALLARRELWHPAGERFAEAALALPPGATHFTVQLGDAQIGYASSTVDTLIDTLRVLEYVVLDVPVLGEVQRTEARTEISLSRTLALRDFTATLRGTDTHFTATGHVEGDSVLEFTLEGDASRSVRRARSRRIATASCSRKGHG